MTNRKYLLFCDKNMLQFSNYHDILAARRMENISQPLLQSRKDGLKLMWTKSRSLLLSRMLTILCLILLVMGVIFLPSLLRGWIAYTGKSMVILTPLLAGLWGSAIPAFISLLCLNRLLSNIRQDMVFIDENVRLIRIVSWCCFIVSAVYFVFCFYYAMGVILAILMGFIGLILRVVKNVIAQAIEIKDENDLTV